MTIDVGTIASIFAICWNFFTLENPDIFRKSLKIKGNQLLPGKLAYPLKINGLEQYFLFFMVVPF